jgi:hypothetical protein
MRSFRLFAALSVLILISSCASVGKLATPSTKPEVTLQNATKRKALDALVAWSATQGRQVTATTEYSITTEGQMDARTSSNILWDESSVARTIYTPVVKGNDVVIYSQRFITFTEESTASNNYGNSNNGVTLTSSRDKTEEYNSQRAFEEMQIELESFARFYAEHK